MQTWHLSIFNHHTRRYLRSRDAVMNVTTSWRLVNNEVLVKPPTGSSVFRMLGQVKRQPDWEPETKWNQKEEKLVLAASCTVLFSVVGFQYFYSLPLMFTVLLVEAHPGPTWYLSERLFILFFWCSDALGGSPALSLSPLSLLMPPLS